MDSGLRDKVALITGSARGLGRAIAEKLAAEHAKIVVSDINEAMAISTAGEIAQAYGVETVAFGHDVSSEESTKDVMRSAISRFSRIDILINNAGITRDARLMMMKQADWDVVLSVNLTGAFICTKLASKTDAEAELREHRQHRERNRSHGKRGTGELFRLKSRADRPHQDDGAGTCRTRDQCQRHRSWIHPVGYDRRAVGRGVGKDVVADPLERLWRP